MTITERFQFAAGKTDFPGRVFSPTIKPFIDFLNDSLDVSSVSNFIGGEKKHLENFGKMVFAPAIIAGRAIGEIGKFGYNFSKGPQI